MFSEEINNPPDKTDCLSLQISHEEVAMVGLEAMELANSTLEDFVSTKNYWVVFSHTVLNHYLFVL